MLQPSDSDRMLGRHLIASHDRWVPFVYSLLFGDGYMTPPFAPVLNETIDKVLRGEITRLIVSIAPRMGKTLSCVWALVSRGYALNPAANIIHTSYGQSLVNSNSMVIRDIIKHTDFLRLFPHVQFSPDASAKGLWKTSAGGQFLAAASGSGITGHGAGILGYEGFSGCLIVDDPNKPDDMGSERITDQVNSRWASTLVHRLANKSGKWKTPVVVIQQRLGENDFTGELLDRSGKDEDWHHLVLPTWIPEDYTYTQSGTPIEHNLPAGSIWSARVPDKLAKKLCDPKETRNSIQHSQEPSSDVGDAFERDWFKRHAKLPNNIKSWSIWCDTASKVNKYNDWTVFQLWAKSTTNQGYLVKQWRKKERVPFIKKRFKSFYDDCCELTGIKEKSSGLSINIEDKDSGTGLIQALQVEGYTVNAIQRSQGKYARALDASDHVRRGKISVPQGSVGDMLIAECTKFKADDSHAHDDMVDPMVDFINHELPRVGVVEPAVVAF